MLMKSERDIVSIFSDPNTLINSSTSCSISSLSIFEFLSSKIIASCKH